MERRREGIVAQPRGGVLWFVVVRVVVVDPETIDVDGE